MKRQEVFDFLTKLGCFKLDQYTLSAGGVQHVIAVWDSYADYVIVYLYFDEEENYTRFGY